MEAITMDGVREYAEGYKVKLNIDSDRGRVVVVALNEAGYSRTLVDLMDLLDWIQNHPQILANLNSPPNHPNSPEAEERP